MAHETSAFRGGRLRIFLDRPVQLPRVAAGKSARAVPPSGMNSVSPTKAALPITCVMQAGVWPGVCIAKALRPANRVGVAILEQAVELAAIALKLGALVEDFAEHLLHFADVLADADLAAELFAGLGRGRQVVGMGVGFDQPFEFQPPIADESDDRSGGAEADAAGRVVEIEDGVDTAQAFEAGSRTT